MNLIMRTKLGRRWKKQIKWVWKRWKTLHSVTEPCIVKWWCQETFPVYFNHLRTVRTLFVRTFYHKKIIIYGTYYNTNHSRFKYTLVNVLLFNMAKYRTEINSRFCFKVFLLRLITLTLAVEKHQEKIK